MYQGKIIKSNKIENNREPKLENVTSLSSVSDEAAIILKKAKEEAEQIRQKALAEAEDNKQQIIKKAQEQAETIAIEKAFEISKNFSEEIASIKVILTSLIGDCVRKIIGELPSKQVHRLVVKTALEEIIEQHKIVIRIPPASYDDRWWENWSWLKSNELDETIFVKDDSILEGRCIVGFAEQEIDIGIETQLATLKKLALKRDDKREDLQSLPNNIGSEV